MCYAKYDGKDITYKDKEQVLKKTGLKIEDPTLPPKDLIKLTGTLSDFKGLFCYAQLGDGAYLSEAQKERQKAKLQKGALLATLNGNTAAGLAALGRANGGDRSNYFRAQYITAQLNNNITLKGWLGYYKFNEGDQVEVIAEKRDDYYEVYAMLKPSEQIISIIPLCYAGRNQAFKAWFWIVFICYIICVLLMNYFVLDFSFENLLIGFSSLGLLIGPASVIVKRNSIATHIKLAERIFTLLGWKNVKNINLITVSKQYIDKSITQGKVLTDWQQDTDPYIKPSLSGNGWYFFYYDPEVLCKEEGNPLSEDNKKTQHEDGQ
ncbi:hypothetical protein J3U65_05385 [Gilliamella sp. B3791]|uniref:putative type VI secretion system effector n=2 Tax=Gilliamella TaxID=1193503 RepID=UPI00226A0B66|nr:MULTISPECIES: putative type VI secretion system effector [unclassified Gilliamella]MCX8643183.1 hypothetical protein [Gilliamella sp. B3835]MCX8706877.1 hypothetical protein [Gilliamella sp. B3783]MCX8708733.1 hypothetical protein [Gilliamella sp. B3780]MCX8715519.1 hypothetical protein [Gilliamella sp. B3784]MCX8718326.1 hypothetical protein [Gilliamella sp. B3788]